MARLKLSRLFLLLCAISFILSVGLYLGRIKIVHFIVDQQLIPGVTIDTLSITELTPQTVRAKRATGTINLDSNQIGVEIEDLYLHHRWRSGQPTVLRAASLTIGPIIKGDPESTDDPGQDFGEIITSALDTLLASAKRVPPLDLSINKLFVLQEDQPIPLSGALELNSEAGYTQLRFQEAGGLVLLVTTDVATPDYELVTIKFEDLETNPLIVLKSESKPDSPNLHLSLQTNLTDHHLLPYHDFLPEQLVSSEFRLNANMGGDLFRPDLLDFKQHTLSAEVDLELKSTDLELVVGTTLKLEGDWIIAEFTSPSSFSSNQQTSSLTSGTARFDFEKVEFDLIGLQSSFISQWYNRPLSGSGDVSFGDDKVELRGIVSDPEFSKAPIALELNMAADGKTGRVHLNLSSSSPSHVISLLQNIPVVPLPELTADRGKVDLKLQSAWGQDTTVTLSGTIEQLDSITPWGEFSGINLALAQTELFPVLKAPPSKLSFARFDPAIPITNGSMTVGMQSSGSDAIVTVSAFRASALGGRISAANINWNLANADNQISLTLEAIDLAEVLALYPQEQVSATGKLSGEVPVISTKGGVVIRGAQLQNLGPGTIKYLGSLSGFGQEQLTMALTALKDYQYSKMLAGLELEENGDFLISLSLEGYGLELNKTRPVNVNLNIEENLPSLLESIRTVRGVQRMISTGITR